MSKNAKITPAMMRIGWAVHTYWSHPAGAESGREFIMEVYSAMERARIAEEAEKRAERARVRDQVNGPQP